MGPDNRDRPSPPSLHSMPMVFLDDEEEYDEDAETVKVDLASLGLEVGPDTSTDVGMAGVEAFSIDSEPHTPQRHVPEPERASLDWALIATAAVGGLGGALVAVWWMLA